MKAHINKNREDQGRAAANRFQKASRHSPTMQFSDNRSKAIVQRKKTGPPIIVFQHPDIMRLVQAKSGKLKNMAVIEAYSIEVAIRDPKILSKFPAGPNYPNQAQKIKDAGNFELLITELARALKEVDDRVGEGAPIDAQENAYKQFVDRAIADCVDRSTTEAGRLGGLKGKAKWAKVKRGGGLVLSLLGATAGVAGLALTPLTFGVSSVVGCVSLAKGGVDIGTKIADIASSAEMMANGIAKDLGTLKKQYSKWLADPEVKRVGGLSNKIGIRELTKRGINALAPTMITTLKGVKGDVDTYDEKINNLEVKADDLGNNLDKWLEKQIQSEKNFREIQALGHDALTEKETKLLRKILILLSKSQVKITELIQSVTELNGRVHRNRVESKKLAEQLRAISVKNPLWSDVGSALFELSSSAAFIFAGSIGAPEPFKHVKAAADIISTLDNARELIQQAHALTDNFKDVYDERKRRQNLSEA